MRDASGKTEKRDLYRKKTLQKGKRRKKESPHLQRKGKKYCHGKNKGKSNIEVHTQVSEKEDRESNNL